MLRMASSNHHRHVVCCLLTLINVAAACSRPDSQRSGDFTQHTGVVHEVVGQVGNIEQLYALGEDIAVDSKKLLLLSDDIGRQTRISASQGTDCLVGWAGQRKVEKAGGTPNDQAERVFITSLQ